MVGGAQVYVLMTIIILSTIHGTSNTIRVPGSGRGSLNLFITYLNRIFKMSPMNIILCNVHVFYVNINIHVCMPNMYVLRAAYAAKTVTIDCLGV